MEKYMQDIVGVVLYVLIGGIGCIIFYSLFYGIKYLFGKIFFNRYRIDHYQAKNGYYPMVKTLAGWKYINIAKDYYSVNSFDESVSQPSIKIAEGMIYGFHEQRTRTTVASLTVKINKLLLKKRQEKAQKYNSKVL